MSSYASLALSGLTSQQRFIIENRLSRNPLGIGKIASKLGMSLKQVRDAESEAIGVLVYRTECAMGHAQHWPGRVQHEYALHIGGPDFANALFNLGAWLCAVAYL